MSFAQPPSLDFNFHTFALAFGDLPFLLDMLKVNRSEGTHTKYQISGLYMEQQF